MENLLEIGQIQIMPEFPAEVANLMGKLQLAEATNLELAAQNVKLTRYLVFGGLLLGVGLILYVITESNKRDEKDRR